MISRPQHLSSKRHTALTYNTTRSTKVKRTSRQPRKLLKCTRVSPTKRARALNLNRRPRCSSTAPTHKGCQALLVLHQRLAILTTVTFSILCNSTNKCLRRHMEATSIKLKSKCSRSIAYLRPSQISQAEPCMGTVKYFLQPRNL